MSRRFPLAVVLRVRQVREDQARADLLHAHTAVREAQALADTRRQALTASPAVTGGPARDLAALLVARHSLAAGLTDAEHRVADAEQAVVDTAAGRHAEAERARELAVEQAVLDGLPRPVAARPAF